MSLSGYGWVDRSKGIARIPIEDAMRIISARGDHAYDPLEPPASRAERRQANRSSAMRGAAFILILALWPAAALAGLTEAQVGQVALSPPPGARVPTALVFKDLDGRDVTLGDAIAGRPTLLLPADFTCTQICGPALSIAAGALSQTGLQAGRDYSLVVVGIDANDSVEDARRFTSGQVGGPGVSVLNGSDETINSLMAAIGYRFQRDSANDCDRSSGRLRHARRGRPGLARAVEPGAAADGFAAGAAGGRGRQDRRHRRPDRVALLRL